MMDEASVGVRHRPWHDDRCEKRINGAEAIQPRRGGRNRSKATRETAAATLFVE
jgi:hypothetical protein